MHSHFIRVVEQACHTFNSSEKAKIIGSGIVGLICAGGIWYYSIQKIIDPTVSKQPSSETLSLKEQKPAYFALVPHFADGGIAITSGDFDGDGGLDVIVGTFHTGKAEIYGLYTTRLGIHPSASASTHKIAEVPYSIGGGLALTSGDFNNDEKLDFMVATVHHNGGEVYLFFNNGKGDFKPYSPPQPLN